MSLLMSPMSYYKLTHEYRDGMILTGYIQKTRIETCCSVTSPTTNLTWTTLGIKWTSVGKQFVTTKQSMFLVTVLLFNTCTLKQISFMPRPFEMYGQSHYNAIN
jgi:hypothetical protein